MSKLKRTSFTVPDATNFARAAINTLGKFCFSILTWNSLQLNNMQFKQIKDWKIVQQDSGFIKFKWVGLFMYCIYQFGYTKIDIHLILFLINTALLGWDASISNARNNGTASDEIHVGTSRKSCPTKKVSIK